MKSSWQQWNENIIFCVLPEEKKSRGVRWEERRTKCKGRLCFLLSVGTLDPKKPHLGCNVQMQRRLFFQD